MNSSFQSKSFASPFFTPNQSNSLNLNDSFIQTNRHFNTTDFRLQSGNAARNLNSILHCRTMIDSESSRHSTPRIYEDHSLKINHFFSKNPNFSIISTASSHDSDILTNSQFTNNLTNAQKRGLYSSNKTKIMTKEELNRTKSFHFGNKEIKELEEKEDEGFLMEISKFYTKNTESPKAEKIEEQRISKKKNQPEGNTVKYDIDIHKICFDTRTTLMIKNIPNKYDRDSFLDLINKNHRGNFDFFYLPIDFNNKCNVGYAFINFNHNKFIKNFYLEFNGRKWEKYNSEKICLIKYARIQGINDLITHFKFSSVMNQKDSNLRPLILNKPEILKFEKLIQLQKQNIKHIN